MNFSLFSGDFFTKRFYFLLFALTLFAFFIRVVNINYASLWSDELYSMLSVHPQNSLYEVLYMQRKDQPPLYFVLLRYWTMLFGFTDISARSLSVAIGTASVFVIGFAGKYLVDAKTGLLAAFITAFGFVQIEHSLEARFYGLLFLLVACSLYTYRLASTTKYKLIVHVIHGGLCGAIILAHHFGAMVVLSYLLFDVWQLFRNRFQHSFFFYTAVTWISAIIVLAPWVFFVYSTVSGVKDYWLKIIDIPSYLLYTVKYNNLLIPVILLISICGLFFVRFKQNLFLQLLFAQVLLVILIPILFSYLLFPILVARYSFAMAPALYLLMAAGMVAFIEKWKRIKPVLLGLLLLILSFDGLNASFINKKPLMKEPWREMAQWLRQQPDFETTPLYSTGYQLKDRFTIDYYLSQKKAIHIRYDTAGLSTQKRFYLVETNGHDVLPENEKTALKNRFHCKEISIGLPDKGKGGTISIFTAK